MSTTQETPEFGQQMAEAASLMPQNVNVEQVTQAPRAVVSPSGITITVVKRKRDTVVERTTTPPTSSGGAPFVTPSSNGGSSTVSRARAEDTRTPERPGTPLPRSGVPMTHAISVEDLHENFFDGSDRGGGPTPSRRSRTRSGSSQSTLGETRPRPVLKPRNAIQKCIAWYQELCLSREVEAEALEVLLDGDCRETTTCNRGVASELGSEARLKFMPEAFTRANEIVITRWIHNQVRELKDVRVIDREHVCRMAVLRAFTPSSDEVLYTAVRNSRARNLRMEDHTLAGLPYNSRLWTRVMIELKRHIFPGLSTVAVPAQGPA